MDDILRHVATVWDYQRSNSPIYSLLLEGIDIYHAENGQIRATLPVQALHVNSKGSLHGTLSACVVDWVAGMAIASTGQTATGVSTDLSVSYLATAKLGDILEIEGQVSKLGKTLAFTSITISKRTHEGTVKIVQGSHTKFIRQ